MGRCASKAAWNVVHQVSNSIAKTYDPPHSLRDQLNHVTLTLAVEHGEVVGKWVLSHTAHNLKERLSALAGHERQEIPLQIPCRDLRDSEGNPRPYGAVPVLKQILDQALILPDNEQTWRAEERL